MIQEQKVNINKEGKLQSFMDATPLKMQCEYGDCKSEQGRDYKRKHIKNDGWDDEPIFLCDKHSKLYFK